MKRLAIVIVILLCAVSIYADAHRTILDLDGSDWKTMSQQDKIMFVSGFMNLGAFIVQVQTTAVAKGAPEETILKMLADKCNTANSVAAVVSNVDAYFYNGGDITSPLIGVILTSGYGK